MSVPYALHSKTAEELGGTITSSQVSDFNTSVTNNSAVLANSAKNTYPSADASKLAGIEEEAEVNVNADWNAASGDAQILNKPALATVATTGSYTDLTNQPVISAGGWGLTGNSSTSPATDFIGTTDDVPLIFRINGTEAGRIECESYTNGNNENIFLGFKSGQNNNGLYNTAVGSNSFVQNTSGSFNAVVGEWALEANTTGSYNSAFGPEAMGLNVSGSYNSAVGYSALALNNTGEGNSAFGHAAIQFNTSGNENSAIGRYSLQSNTEGSYNSALGRGALYSNQTGSYNTAVGANADVNGNPSNATAIGAGAVVNTSNTIQLGNDEVTQVYAGVNDNATIYAGGLQVKELHVYGGSPGAGKVLTSDASGVATWQAAGGGESHYIGELYGGGVVFWVDQTGSHGLICSMIDNSTAIIWTTSAYQSIIVPAPGALSDWNGQSNTNAIVTQAEAGSTYAAGLCDAYTNTDYGTGVYSDWYLPSRGELNHLWNNIYQVQKALDSDGNGATTAITKNNYWSSSEYSSSNIWYFNFTNGFTSNATKNGAYYVRAVRAF